MTIKVEAQALEDLFPLVVIHNAINVEHEGTPYMALWVECYNERELPVQKRVYSILSVTDMEGRIIQHSDVEREVKIKARRARVQQIHSELGIDGSEITDPQLIHSLLSRVWAGEWMGQHNYGEEIYILNELDVLFNWENVNIWEKVNELVKNGEARRQEGSWVLRAPENEP